MRALASLDRAVSFADRIPLRAYAPVVVGIIALQALILLAMGRVPMCTCGTIKLWHGVVNSSENSQHIFDWYSFTHVLHGIWLYLLTWLVLPRAPVVLRLILAVFLEGAWEVLENTNFVIERYRASTISLDYYGDSIVNSVSDTFTMMFGFLLARMLPVWGTIAVIVAIELTLGYLIRDNLFFNILMLIYPLDGVKAWQSALPG
jgi:Protein of unknown function (DUF2585)